MENEAKLLSDIVRTSTSQLTSVLVDTNATSQEGTQSEDKEAAREILRVAGIHNVLYVLLVSEVSLYSLTMGTIIIISFLGDAIPYFLLTINTHNFEPVLQDQ